MTEHAQAQPDLAARVAELEGQLEELEARAGEAEAKRDEYLDDLRRLAADFDNFRKRAARDQEALVARAHERLVKELLPVLDDLERALEAAVEARGGEARGGRRSSSSGSCATRSSGRGSSRSRPTATFDPHVHEALLTQPSEDGEGTIVEVLQKGYQLGDRVLRPARVVLSAGPAADARAP